jgi:hypothetical protein
LSGTADERFALPVLVGARRLAEKTQSRSRIADAEDRLLAESGATGLRATCVTPQSRRLSSLCFTTRAARPVSKTSMAFLGV